MLRKCADMLLSILNYNGINRGEREHLVRESSALIDTLQPGDKVLLKYMGPARYRHDQSEYVTTFERMEDEDTPFRRALFSDIEPMRSGAFGGRLKYHWLYKVSFRCENDLWVPVIGSVFNCVVAEVL